MVFIHRGLTIDLFNNYNYNHIYNLYNYLKGLIILMNIYIK